MKVRSTSKAKIFPEGIIRTIWMYKNNKKQIKEMTM